MINQNKKKIELKIYRDSCPIDKPLWDCVDIDTEEADATSKIAQQI